MEYILTERQFELISKRLVSEQLSKVAEKPIEKNLERLGLGAERVISRGEALVSKLEKSLELKNSLSKEQREILDAIYNREGYEGLERQLKNWGLWDETSASIWKNYKPSGFNLTKSTPSKPRPVRDYGKVKISDNLVMITKPRWKDYVAEVQNIKNTDQSISLKKGTDKNGEFYYFSAKMENPIDAGKSIRALIERIPKGARFGEPATGSLSTDSFYNMLRRVKSFEPKVIGRVRLNKSGVKRFQEYIKNPVQSNEYPPILRFKSFTDAKPLLDALNDEIQKVGLGSSATISKNSDGLFEILIPNIELRMK